MILLNRHGSRNFKSISLFVILSVLVIQIDSVRAEEQSSAVVSQVFSEIVEIRQSDQFSIIIVPERLRSAWEYFCSNSFGKSLSTEEHLLRIDVRSIDSEIEKMKKRISHAQDFYTGMPKIEQLIQDTQVDDSDRRTLVNFIIDYRDVWSDMAFLAYMESVSAQLEPTRMEAEFAVHEIDAAIRFMESLINGIASGEVKDVRDFFLLADKHAPKKEEVLFARMERDFRGIKAQLEMLRELAQFNGTGELPEPAILQGTLQRAHSRLAQIISKTDDLIGFVNGIRERQGKDNYVLGIAVANHGEQAVALSPSGWVMVRSRHESGNTTDSQGEGIRIPMVALGAEESEDSSSFLLRQWLQKADQQARRPNKYVDLTLPSHEFSVVYFETRDFKEALESSFKKDGPIYLQPVIFEIGQSTAMACREVDAKLLMTRTP